jgi:mRNA-decapping enzyme subunit 2
MEQKNKSPSGKISGNNKKTIKKSRSRKNQSNPAPNTSNPISTPPSKILQRNNKSINLSPSPTPMAISPQPEEAPQIQHEYTLNEALDDLLIRFILNCPEEEHESMDRLFFQIEEAHWFYEDFYRENCKTLPELKFRDFVEKIFAHCPLLAPYRSKVDAHTQSFYQYKSGVPVCGAIILNETLDKVLLVKGWSNKSSWSFPRGKINKDEPTLQCAIREVYEETGFDISRHGANEKDFIELVLGEQKIQLFVVTGVSEDTVFVPQTRKEISACEWHTFDKILERSPTTQKTSGKYWAVVPFVRKLKKWIALNKKRLTRQPRNKKQPAGNRRGRKQQSQPTTGRDSPDMMSMSPPRQTDVVRQLFNDPQSHSHFTYTYPQQQHYNYGYNSYTAPQPPAYYYPDDSSMKTSNADSLLSFSFNMNEIFEDSAVQNVVA